MQQQNSRSNGSEESPEHYADPEQVGSGLVEFLVDEPSSVGGSRAALLEAMRALIRERDYLRRARDLRQAEHAAEVAELRAHVGELEGLLGTERRERELLTADRDTWRERAKRALWRRVLRTLLGRLRGRRG